MPAYIFLMKTDVLVMSHPFVGILCYFTIVFKGDSSLKNLIPIILTQLKIVLWIKEAINLAGLCLEHQHVWI